MAESKAPAFLKGIQPLDVAEQLKTATPEQLAALRCHSVAYWAAFANVRVDGHVFNFDRHRYLLPIYLDDAPEIAWMKSAQMGATVYVLLWLLWWCRYNQVKAGMFFPTSDGVENLSKDRVNPLIRSNAELDGATDGTSLAIKQIRNIHGGVSSLYMLYLGGQASKDSVPLDIIGFDELRLVNEQDVDQAQERVSHSEYKLKRFVSTAGLPNSDIHKRFLLGTQNYWHCVCGCRDGFIPSEEWPNCVVEHRGETYLRCPRCKYRINNPQNGRYIAHNPQGAYPSYHISQLISNYITVKEVWDNYNRTTNKKEFYNAKLGTPYVDKESQPITDEVLQNCVNPELRWAKYRRAKDRRNMAMGVDQHAGNIYVVLTERMRSGKLAIAHLEIVERDNPEYYEAGHPVSPFKRAHQIVREFDVGMGVIDSMPNYNEAVELCHTFPKRIFAAFYQDGGKDIVQWADRLKDKENVKKSGKDTKNKWQCTISRYLSIDYALQKFVDREIEIPNPDALTQLVRSEETGHVEAEAIGRTRWWKHMQGVAKQKKIIDKDTGKERMEWVRLGIDPHFLHATNYSLIAMSRLSRRSIMVI